MSGGRTQRTRRRGFTLIELMVSLLAGSLVITAAWRMSSVSSQMFNRQMRRADMGAMLRRGSAIMRRDITRAGYFSIRSAEEMPSCGGSDVTPINQPGVSVGLITAGALGPRQALYVTGNLTSNDQYPSQPLVAANTVTLNPLNDEFRMSFVDPATNSFVVNDILRAFVPNPQGNLLGPQGRYISISDGPLVFLRELTSINVEATTGNTTLTFTPSLPLAGGAAGGGACFSAGQVVMVAPVATYRYAIEQSPIQGMPRMANTDALIGNQARYMLVRREINMATRAAAEPTPIAGTEYVVLDFLENFSVSAVWDTTPPPPVGTTPGTPVLAFERQPETLGPRQWMIRSLIFDLVVRPPSERTTDPARQGQARTEEGRRWSRFELNLPNMARRAGTI